MDPWTEVRWYTKDGRLLTREQALATVPGVTADIRAWLNDNYAAVYLGISGSKTGEWQWVETAGLLGLAAILVLVTFPVVDRRRPT
jgi:hypothetical protein